MAHKKKSTKGDGKRGAMASFPEIEQLLGFMDKHGLDELEYEHEGLRVRLKRPSAQQQLTLRSIPAPEIVVAAPAGPAGGDLATDSGLSGDVHIVKSPIVGTFYSSPSPGAEAFVAVGSRVESGQVLCIIEAMKLMNEIESDVAGEVVRIFAENGNPVEYGEPLFAIHPHRKK
jgi:acetyl-CoA carboxylase biotin carboxyl carrier protein